METDSLALILSQLADLEAVSLRGRPSFNKVIMGNRPLLVHAELAFQ